MSGRRWDANAAARLLEIRTDANLDDLQLPQPYRCFTEIQYYLQRMTDTHRTTNRTLPLSRRTLDTGEMQINAGPSIFREPGESCIQFRSGAQLSFGVTVRVRNGRTELLAYRFHLELLPTSGIKFVRIDLNPAGRGHDPLHTPRSHFHAGFPQVHFPWPVMRPLEVLDRIFHVIEPAFTS